MDFKHIHPKNFFNVSFLIMMRIAMGLLLVTVCFSTHVQAASSSDSTKYEKSADELYNKNVNRADWMVMYGRYTLARDYYADALMIRPNDHYCKLKINELNDLLDRQRLNFLFFPEIDFDRPITLVIFLVLVIMYSIVTMVVLLIVMLINRERRVYITKLKEKSREEYQSLLIDYLFETEDSINQSDLEKKFKSIAKTDFTRVILIDEMIDLSINLKGDSASKLRELYIHMGLDKDSYALAQSIFWHLRVKGFRELAFMNIVSAEPIIRKALKSQNNIIRSEAQLALVRLNKNDPFSFLDTLHKPFTLWEQNKLHEMIIYHNLEVPSFKKWLYSDNRTIVIFAIDMIRLFKEMDAVNDVIEIVSHENRDVRSHAYNTLGDLCIKAAVPALIHRFHDEQFDNKILILKALSRMQMPENIIFFKKVIEEENEVYVQIEAAKGILNLGIEGEKELQLLLNSEEYRNYQIIIKHVLDKRI